MKLADVIKILAKEFKVSKLEEINKALKADKAQTRFRLSGPAFRNTAWTGTIKAITEEGVKIHNVNRVNLIRYDEIKTLDKALPKEAAPQPKGTVKAVAKSETKSLPKKSIQAEDFDDDDDDYENDDDFDPYADEEDDVIEQDEFKPQIVKKLEDERPKSKKKQLGKKGTGSLFIPKKK